MCSDFVYTTIVQSSNSYNSIKWVSKFKHVCSIYFLWVDPFYKKNQGGQYKYIYPLYPLQMLLYYQTKNWKFLFWVFTEKNPAFFDVGHIIHLHTVRTPIVHRATIFTQDI